MFERYTWLNEPRNWHLQDGVLTVTTDANTDFWRETHYGFTRDSGHFLHCATAGDFTAELRVAAHYDQLYDQAGIMVRLDAANWVKAGVEISDGRRFLSSVLTLDRSDWATGIFEGDPADFRLRATVKSGVLRLQVSADGRVWRLARLAPFPRATSYAVGPMCCTPERAGLEVRFSEFSVGPALEKGLHDVS